MVGDLSAELRAQANRRDFAMADHAATGLRSRNAAFRSHVMAACILVSSAMLAACGDRQDELLVGHWRSDESRTLLAMDLAEASGRLTEQAAQNEAFYRDQFFGRLRVYFEHGRSKSWFPDEGEGVDDVPWDAFNVEHIEANRYLFVGEDDRTGKAHSREFLIEPGRQCYSVEMPSLGFSEWFCRVKPD